MTTFTSPTIAELVKTLQAGVISSGDYWELNRLFIAYYGEPVGECLGTSRDEVIRRLQSIPSLWKFGTTPTLKKTRRKK